MSDLVSVIIPAFNAENFVKSAIESALSQREHVAEIIVVDDGSTDFTADVVAGFSDKVIYRRQSNAGPAAARNWGASFATGDWIAFLDADDVWLPGKLEEQLFAARHTNPGVVYTNILNTGECSNVASSRPFNKLPHGDIFEFLLHDNFIPLSSVLIRRDLFLAVDGFSEEFVGTEDWDLWMRLAAEGVRFEVVREPLVEYRWRNDSLSKDHCRMKELRQRTVGLALATPRGQRLSWRKRKSVEANALATSAWFAEQSDELRPAARQWYASATATAPWNINHWRKWVKSLLPNGR